MASKGTWKCNDCGCEHRGGDVSKTECKKCGWDRTAPEESAPRAGAPIPTAHAPQSAAARRAAAAESAERRSADGVVARERSAEAIPSLAVVQITGYSVSDEDLPAVIGSTGTVVEENASEGTVRVTLEPGRSAWFRKSDVQLQNSTGEKRGAPQSLRTKYRAPADIVEQDLSASAAAMISTLRGKWRLLGQRGDYSYDPASGRVSTGDKLVGCFDFSPISPTGLEQASGTASLRCIGVKDSEIIAEVAKRENQDAYFVLPSQLNGAEYPSHGSIVRAVEDYRYDNTGGPRGQLAVHPAAAQFVLDNAACDDRPDGINAVDQILKRLNAAGVPFRLQNGYLKIPKLHGAEQYDQAIQMFKENLHTLRPLVMQDVEASGANPSLRDLTGNTHRVNLVYASAVPVQSYLNRADGKDHLAFMEQIAFQVLVGQYCGALKHAAARRAPSGGGKRTVFLMPLGGGVFCNPLEIIAKAMSCAMEMLSQQERDMLDVQVLTYKNKHREGADFEAALKALNKLKK